MEQFLLTAKVVTSQEVNKGITNILRLTLTDGTLTHDAHFQSVDRHKACEKEVLY
jgi:recombination DNA repair RAD52 pathway protein